jgi:catechol 2,3-dioxygenase-like lactoylglutathione lyase family enzyme
MAVVRTLSRVLVDDVDRSLPTFEAVYGRPADMDVVADGVRFVTVGATLLISAPPEARDHFRQMHGPLLVDDLDTTLATVVGVGAEVEARFPSPAGTVAYVRHPDGLRVEYVQPPESQP